MRDLGLIILIIMTMIVCSLFVYGLGKSIDEQTNEFRQQQVKCCNIINGTLSDNSNVLCFKRENLTYKKYVIYSDNECILVEEK